jgi:hypothetical protein
MREIGRDGKVRGRPPTLAGVGLATNHLQAQRRPSVAAADACGRDITCALNNNGHHRR